MIIEGYTRLFSLLNIVVLSLVLVGTNPIIVVVVSEKFSLKTLSLLQRFSKKLF